MAVIKRMFRWAVSEEIVDVSVYQALQTVESIAKRRDPRVTESEKIRPVLQEHIDAVREAACPQIRSMITLQELTGMRPDEVTAMRPCDIDRTGDRFGVSQDVWVYVPESHKCDWRNLERFVLLGPQAQQVIVPWLGRAPERYLFSPKEVVAQLRGNDGSRRKEPRPMSSRSTKYRPRDRYDDDTYRRAIARICRRLGIPPWGPNRLRHTAATRIRARYGIETARTVLGHQATSTTEIYAERDVATAATIMLEIG